MRYTGPKARRCRRQGLNLFGSAKYDRALQHRAGTPGKGPRARQGKQSEFALQLLEKQKARELYGVAEAQFRRYVQRASRAHRETGRELLELLERRLDNVLYRSGFAMTRFQARQFASHGLFLVNGRRVNLPSLQLSPGDRVDVRPRVQQSPVFVSIRSAHEKYVPPVWLKVDPAALSIEVVSPPADEHLEASLDVQKIVEFYSR